MKLMKQIKEVPHAKDSCIAETRWFLRKLLDEKNELKKVLLIKFIREHIDHLA